MYYVSRAVYEQYESTCGMKWEDAIELALIWIEKYPEEEVIIYDDSIEPVWSTTSGITGKL